MKIDIKKLSALRQYSGEFSFRYVPDPALIDIPYVTFASDVAIAGRYYLLEDDSVEIEATVEYRLQGLCSRCLQPAEKSVRYQLHEYFVTEENGEDYVYQKGVVDLSQAVQDAIMLSLPNRLLCTDCEE